MDTLALALVVAGFVLVCLHIGRLLCLRSGRLLLELAQVDGAADLGTLELLDLRLDIFGSGRFLHCGLNCRLGRLLGFLLRLLHRFFGGLGSRGPVKVYLAQNLDVTVVRRDVFGSFGFHHLRGCRFGFLDLGFVREDIGLYQYFLLELGFLGLFAMLLHLVGYFLYGNSHLAGLLLDELFLAELLLHEGESIRADLGTGVGLHFDSLLLEEFDKGSETDVEVFEYLAYSDRSFCHISKSPVILFMVNLRIPL